MHVNDATVESRNTPAIIRETENSGNTLEWLEWWPGGPTGIRGNTRASGTCGNAYAGNSERRYVHLLALPGFSVENLKSPSYHS